ncbi:MAG: hypothetical protein V1731_00240 [Candidatus Aenigmatarchaeota archaeon]
MTTVSVRHLLRAVEEVVADSRRVSAGAYCIRIVDGTPRNVQKRHMAELGIIGTALTVRHNEYEDARTIGGGARTNPIKVYPVNFERAEFYMDKLSAIMRNPGANHRIYRI